MICIESKPYVFLIPCFDFIENVLTCYQKAVRELTKSRTGINQKPYGYQPKAVRLLTKSRTAFS